MLFVACKILVCLPYPPPNVLCAFGARCGCSSGVERHLAKVDVVSSNLITRSNFPKFGAVFRPANSRLVLIALRLSPPLCEFESHHPLQKSNRRPRFARLAIWDESGQKFLKNAVSKNFRHIRFGYNCSQFFKHGHIYAGAAFEAQGFV